MTPTHIALDPRRPSPQPAAQPQMRPRTLPQTLTQTQPQMQKHTQPQPQMLPQPVPQTSPLTKTLPLPQSLLQPQTPPPEPGRAPSRARRYPAGLARELDAQGNPRQLLHRRSTSHTYETLEDLLKEAGYKETRICTPAEHEPPPLSPSQDEHSGMRGAVVRLFSAWMSAAGSSRPAHEDAGSGDTRAPPSPLARRSTDASSLRLPSPPHSAYSAAARSLARASLASPPPPHVPGRLRPGLRHTASTPHIDKRPRQRRPSRPSNAAASPPPPVPPLPATWLQALSAALRSPPLSESSPASASPPSAALFAPRTPPSAWARTRAPTSTSLTPTTVLCRSAPGSRSPSLSARAPLPSLAQCEESSRVPLGSAAPAPAGPPHGEDDEDEDEPDLDLLTMLIPAKRQHSIRSLRSVLLQHQRLSEGSGLDIGPRQRSARVEQYDVGAGTRVRRRGDVDENDAEGLWDSGEFLAGALGAAGGRGRRRRGRMPRSWEWARA